MYTLRDVARAVPKEIAAEIAHGDERSRRFRGAHERLHVRFSGYDRHGSAAQLLRIRFIAISLMTWRILDLDGRSARRGAPAAGASHAMSRGDGALLAGQRCLLIQMGAPRAQENAPSS